MREKKTDPELPVQLPFEPGQASNGEFVPLEQTPTHRAAAALAHEAGERLARKQGLDRRRFLMSTAGIAVTLSAINLVGCDDGDKKGLPPGVESGGVYNVPADADPDACRALEGDEFIFDVQTHHVDPRGEWVSLNPRGAEYFRMFRRDCSEAEKLDCLSRYYYAHDIFLESDTTLAVLSDTPSPAERYDPLTFGEMKRTRDIINHLSPPNTGRLRLHSIVVPNVGRIEAQLEQMQARAEAYDVAAWKVYTPYGPTGRGWWLDDPDTGIPLIEQARRLGVTTICTHKGLPLQGFSIEHASPRDVGVVAKAYPDVNFVIYHSGWFPGTREGPYDPANAVRGTNALVKSLLDHGVGPNQNVYAELGSTWRNVMSDRTQAAHVLGKLLTYVGEDNVLWGTDCIWSGSPQPQIVALRAFQMDAQFARHYGYAPLTDAVKRKVFGLNAARLYGVGPVTARCRVEKDEVERLRAAWRDVEGDSHEPRWAARAPTTRRGMLRWFAANGGRWQML
jgi:predicted TIM-barrel fold metal-dependent hydrolase